jgi:cyclase
MAAPELREIGTGLFAYVQSGSWGYSNAGLITSVGASLLVDTLYDLALTRSMLDAMRRATPLSSTPDIVVNTHADGDHCWGNQLVRGARIISSRSAALEMQELSPKLMATLVGTARVLSRLGPARRFLAALSRIRVPRLPELAEAADFVVECFGSFHFRGIELTKPTETFDGSFTLRVGDKTVELVEVGPAHSKGDVFVHVPSERVVFSGDILFAGSHPIMWQGPVENWIRACDLLLALDVDVIVPGHGPLTDIRGVRATKDYWERLVVLTDRGRRAGASTEEIAWQALQQGFGDRSEAHRLVANVDAIRREQEGHRSRRDPLDVMAMMARVGRDPKRTASNAKREM